MAFSPFRKNMLEIYWQYAKIKFEFSLTVEQIKNRKLRSDSISNSGFIPLKYEWWHFNVVPNMKQGNDLK
jgi:D-alanyl-D-alanine dipeptidase